MISIKMYRQINTMLPQKQNQIVKLIQQGYSTARIRVETGATNKQINAVAAWIKKYL